MSGASAKDALLMAAGVQPGQVATLQRQLHLASEESRQWREKAAQELELSKTTVAERDKERVGLLEDLSKAIASLEAAQQQILTFETRIAELTTTIEVRNQQLAHSLSLSGLSDSAAAAVNRLRDRMASGDIAVDAA